jgi:hypothetical protein
MTHNSIEKLMLTIVWNPRGFHSIEVLEKSRKLKTDCYIAEILKPKSQWRSIEAAGNERKMLIHGTMRVRIPLNY